MSSRLQSAAIAAGATLIGVVVPAVAAEAVELPPLPRCNAALSDEAANVGVARYNAAVRAQLGQTYAYQRLMAATASTRAAYLRNPTTTTRAAYRRALAAQNAYLAARSLRQASASVTPPGVVSDGAARQWGTYRTRVYLRGSVIQPAHVCTTVAFTSSSANEVTEVRTTYVANVVPTLRAAALTPTAQIPGMGKAAVLARVQEEVVTSLGGAAAPIGAGSGASYSIAGFRGSLQAALAKARA